MKIIVFGATGDVGSRVVKEALSRGHDVTAVVRNKHKAPLVPSETAVEVAEVSDTERIARIMAGHDLAVSALRPPQGREADLPALTEHILEAAARTTIRVLVVGGAATLKMPDGSGHTVLSAPDFLPDDIRPIAEACRDQFDSCEREVRVDWTYFSPPAMLTPGTRTGQYRRGSDILLVDADGRSAISMEDFAVAMLDQAEKPVADSRHITVAY